MWTYIEGIAVPSPETFTRQALDMIDQAQSQGLDRIEINASDLHRAVGGYPGAGHQMPVACITLINLMKDGDEVTARPPKGYGPTLTVRFKLPR